MVEIGIIGESGFVGSETASYFRDQNIKIISPKSDQIDIRKADQIDKFIHDYQSDSILLLAAYTNVKNSQTDEGKFLARDINIRGTRNVAEACKKYNKHLIYVSTDYVFEGTEESPGPYETDAEIAPVESTNLSNYARSKIEAENLLRDYDNVAIIRISYPFYDISSSKDYINKLERIIKNGYGIVNDQVVTPTYIVDFVQAAEVICKKKMTGIFHVATYPPTTPYEFISYKLNKNDLKQGSICKLIESGEVPVPVKGGLEVKQTEKRLGLEFHKWRDAVDEVIFSSD